MGLNWKLEELLVVTGIAIRTTYCMHTVSIYLVEVEKLVAMRIKGFVRVVMLTGLIISRLRFLTGCCVLTASSKLVSRLLD